MGLLVGLMDIATANNTVAIVMANPIAKEMAEEYKITPKKTASILDTFSCVFQGVIPYGAQMLIAAGLAQVNPLEIMPYLYYPYILGATALLYIIIQRHEKEYSNAAPAGTGVRMHGQSDR